MGCRGAALLLSTLGLAGCGLGPGEERSGGAELRVTRDFGQKRLGQVRLDRVRRDSTVMRLLRSRFRVETRYGGRFVQSIDGLEGGGPEGRVDWFFFVNGIESGVGAADYVLSPGDLVQWDRRRWEAAMRVPAIVGAFPEPLRTGLKGKRFPVRVECGDAASVSCRGVKRRLRDRGVKATGSKIGAPGTENVIRVVVAPWRQARVVRAARVLERGPERSGVYARFDAAGRRLELLDAAGRVARRAPAGTGLVAALAPSATEIIWLVTAPDRQGVEAAARAVEEATLRDAYAVAATPGGVEKLPLP